LRIDGHLKDMEEIGLIKSAARVRAKMRGCGDLGQALDGVSYVQESVPENREIKARVTAEIDAAVPDDVIIGSSWSAIPGSDFLADVAGRHRCIIAHPANPPYLLPVVELVPAPFTAPETTKRCRALMAEIGQIPVILRKEVPGFVMNRLQTGVVNEAVQLV